MSNGRMICLVCSKEYAQSGFYKHKNPIINERFGFCKKCVVSEIKPDDMSTLYSYLRTMNIPYIKDNWKSANESKSETIGTYLKMVNLKTYRDLEFEDGDSLSGKTNQQELRKIEMEDVSITEDVLRRWGRTLEEEDYIILEEEFNRLGGHDVDNLIEESTIKNIARTQWMANKALDEGDHVKYEKMIRILSTQMNDAEISPARMKKNKTNSMESWAEWVAFIEKNEPVEEGEEDYEPKYLSEYINRWFISQMKRIFGKTKDEDIKKMDGEEI